MSDVVELIGKLLRQAEGTTHEAEASAFMERAQTLATRHSIDLAIARAAAAKAEQREQPEERTVVIGTKGQRGLAQMARLYLSLAYINDVETVVRRDSTVVYPMGMPSDIDVVDALYASLVIQMKNGAEAFLSSPEYPGHWQVPKVTARISFMAGFTQRMYDLLAAAKDSAVAAALEHEAHLVDANPQALTSMALVLREKKAEVEAFRDERHRVHKPRGRFRADRRRAPEGSSFRAGQEHAEDVHSQMHTKRIEAGRA